MVRRFHAAGNAGLDVRDLARNLGVTPSQLRYDRRVLAQQGYLLETRLAPLTGRARWVLVSPLTDGCAVK